MTITITNEQVEQAIHALNEWNPEVSFEVKLRLNRNLRKLSGLQSDKRTEHTKLIYSVVKDKDARKIEGHQGIILNVEEAERLQPQVAKLMSAAVEADVHPIEIYDSTESDSKPANPKFAVDLATVAVPNHILSALLDVVLFPVLVPECCK